MKLLSLAILMVLACAGIVSAAPADPVNLANTTGNFWVNHTWGAGSDNTLIAGDWSGEFSGFNRTWDASTWQSDTAVVGGLGDVGSGSTPDVFQKDGTWYLISGNGDGTFSGFNWTGSAWQSDTAIASGLGDIGDMSLQTTFLKDGTWYLITGEYDGVFAGFNWTGSTWQSDAAIAGGLGDIGASSTPNVFQKDGTWYLIAGENNGAFFGFNWTGSAWQSDAAITGGLGDIGMLSSPTVFQTGGTWYLISAGNAGVTGFNWTGSAWQSDTAIASGLGDVGTYAAPTVFQMGAADSYNISVNDVWHNGTPYTVYKDTYSARAWQNITVYAYNNDSGISAGSVSQNTQIPNNAIVITNTSDWSGDAGNNVYVDYDASDADGDAPTFSCSRTDLFTDFSPSTGTGNWTTALGVYSVDFGVSDGHGSTDNYTMTISGRSPIDPTLSAYGIVFDEEDYVFGYIRSASPPWSSYDGILAGLYNYGNFCGAGEAPHACTFEMNGSQYIISHCESTSSARGHRWTEFGWERDYDIVDGIQYTVTLCAAPTVFVIDGDYHIIFGGTDGTGYHGYSWNTSQEKWVHNVSMVAGLGVPGTNNRPCVFEKDGTHYLISGEHHGSGIAGFYGFNWTGTTWQSDNDIIGGLPTDIGTDTMPNVFYYLGDWYLVSPGEPNTLHGYKLVDDVWQEDDDIVDGLNPTSHDCPSLLVFGMDSVRCVVLRDANENIIRGAQVSLYDMTENTFISKWETSADGIIVPESGPTLVRVSVRTFDGVFTEAFDFSTAYIHEMAVPLNYNVDIHPVDESAVPIDGVFVGLAEYAVSEPQAFWGMDLASRGYVPVTSCSGFERCDIIAEKPGYDDYHVEALNWTSCSAMVKEYRHDIVMEVE